MAEATRVAAYVEVVPGAGICQARLYSIVSYVTCEEAKCIREETLAPGLEAARCGGPIMETYLAYDLRHGVCCDANGGNPAPSWLCEA